MEEVLNWIGGGFTWFIGWLNSAWDWLVNAWKTADYWLNRPLPVAGLTIGGLAAMIFSVAWFIFKNTSFGKKTLHDLKQGYTDITRKYEEFKSDVNNTSTKLKEFYEKQLTIVEAQKHEENKLLLLIAENSHNAKIKEALKDYRGKLGVASTNLEDYLKEKEKDIRLEVEKEYQERYNDKLADLEKKYQELENKLVIEEEKPLDPKDEELIEEDLEVSENGEEREN